jgi:hypothetical protein
MRLAGKARRPKIRKYLREELRSGVVRAKRTKCAEPDDSVEDDERAGARAVNALPEDAAGGRMQELAVRGP